MGRRTRMMTPTTKPPVFEVQTSHLSADQHQWTVAEALEMLRSGYSLQRVIAKTGKNPVHLRELARANRIEVRER